MHIKDSLLRIGTAFALVAALAVPTAPPAEADLLPSLNNVLSNLSLPVLGSPSGSGSGSSPLLSLPGGSLPSLIPSILNGNSSPSSNSTNTALVRVQSDIVLPLTVKLLDTPSSSMKVMPGLISSNGKTGDIIDITVGEPRSDSHGTVFHAFDSVKDWSGFDTLGLWIYPDSQVPAKGVRLSLFSDTRPDDDNRVRIFELPSLAGRQWSYVRFDLEPDDDAPLLVGSYGLTVSLNSKVALRVRPLVLGPGKLDHFKLEHLAKGAVRIIAEDIAGNVLDHGDGSYDGRQLLTFTRDAIGVNAGDLAQATATVRFDQGVSEIVSLDAILPGATADVEVTEGTISSGLGDFSYSLFGRGTGEPTGTVSDPAHSLLLAAPDPATVGTPVLVTVVARTDDEVQRAEGGDTVSVSVTGAAQLTLSASDNDDGTYEASFTPTVAGDLTISATLNGSQVGEDGDGTSDGQYHLAVNGTGGPNNKPRSGGGGGRRNRFGTGAVTQTITAGAEACDPYMTSYIRRGENNDPAQVMKLQEFLRGEQGMTNVPLNGVYDQTTFNAVLNFQEKYVKDILSPWQTAIPTGYVYITTLKTINYLHCHGDTDAAVPASFLGCTIFNVALKPGSTGAEVTKAQQFLVSKGYMATPPSWGYYGPLTTAAVKKFQTDHWAEILTPVGATAPTGNWLSMTMREATDVSCAQS